MAKKIDPEGEVPQEEPGVDVEESGEFHASMVIDVVQDEATSDPNLRKRRLVRREGRPLTSAERRIIDDQLVTCNGDLHNLESEKAASNKKYTGEIAEARQMMDDAIEVLRRDTVDEEFVRMETFDFTKGTVTYTDIDSGEVVDERDITDEERQTSMNL